MANTIEGEKTLSGVKTLLIGSANSATSSSATYNIKIMTSKKEIVR